MIARHGREGSMLRLRLRLRKTVGLIPPTAVGGLFSPAYKHQRLVQFLNTPNGSWGNESTFNAATQYRTGSDQVESHCSRNSFSQQNQQFFELGIVEHLVNDQVASDVLSCKRPHRSRCESSVATGS